MSGDENFWEWCRNWYSWFALYFNQLFISLNVVKELLYYIWEEFFPHSQYTTTIQRPPLHTSNTWMQYTGPHHTPHNSAVQFMLPQWAGLGEGPSPHQNSHWKGGLGLPLAEIHSSRHPNELLKFISLVVITYTIRVSKTNEK